MQLIHKIGCVLGLILTFQLTPAQAFNPAAHLYIAGQVYPNTGYANDLYYDSIASDIALYVEDLIKWPTSFTDTHYDYIDLKPYAWGGRQKAFAKGWLTHNEYWGADYYAHIQYPAGSNTGYVIEKADILYQQTGLDPELAHYAIEVAIDMLLKADEPGIAKKLLSADLLRSWEDRNLLVKVLVLKEGRTDWGTLFLTEMTFRNLVSRYAAALALPGPYDKAAMAKLGSSLAQEFYGIEISPAELLFLLESSMEICRDDYKEVIDDAIDGIRSNLQ